MAPTVADYLLERLRSWDVQHVFAYAGDGINGILAAWGRAENKPQFVQARHEEMAAFEAVGYAKFTGRVGVCMATSGPGATNSVTGITDALMDSIPLVVITGQVPTHLIGTDAFQECDTVGITRPCTKHNYLVKDVADLPHVLHEAFKIATTGT